jgi:hypothetical protein
MVKTNSVNKQEFAGMCRSKNVELCAIGALAAYFFQQFNVDNEAFPNLKHPKSWYTIKVFRACGEKNYFLQDAAIMIDRRPKDRIWKHRIFQMNSFLRFKEEVMAAITDLPRPQESVLRDVMPHLIDLQKGQHQTVMSALAVQSQQLSKMSQDSSSISNTIKDIFTGRTPVHLNSDHPGFRVSTNMTNEGASSSTCQF